ncbi:DNA helicase-2/ATP-dependent DNA helicase PcrA [Metamycoplasma subdolum]|uniref:DNA 3'-5' helicase n=1 Tax=Metamycoplasma subdolum TaxID=92407 RepID=A0A3M0A6U4_9BACT|nr:UvrD-helicase domain-containing protein [Metamycoplasma subdolum]RMA78528.1 DNA helicase-2/ATP-dependent DNA helicase PcrA [Metamycoplasma subdolum]WPB50460.1 UvrD-helicase domain-containing protein [Metamycoplasma subdolum]
MDINLDTLNLKQKDAVVETEGPIRIIAGAGSGKTRVLTYKVAYLIKNNHVNPSEILALTFSNKAANEMKQRVQRLLDFVGKNTPIISTFHSMCSKILRQEIHNFNYPNDFQIVDELDQKEVLRVVYNELGINQTQYTFASIISYIQNQKNDLKTPQDLLKDEETKDDIRAKIYQYYQAHLDKAHTLDFDDLLLFVYKLFYEPKFANVAKKWESKFKYILVDEFQDTSWLQYKIVKKLAKKWNNITIVGDPDQTIYSWRNADINIIMNFDKDFVGTKTIKLEQNYRSTKKILTAANNLISKNKIRLDKKLFTENEEGEDIEFFCGFSDEAEARWIAQKISELKRNRVQLKNIAILFRINSYSRAIEEALIKENTIYKLFGSIKFYQREEIKDALAYLRVIHDGSEISLLRIINKPSRKIGDSTIEKLLKYAASLKMDLFTCLQTKFKEIQINLKLSNTILKNLAELINNIRWAKRALQINPIHSTLKELIINRIGYFEEIKSSEEEYEVRMENFLSLISAIEEWEKKNLHGTIDEYLQEITLITDRDVEDDAASYVSLMTVHNAKGLEFDYVFVAGLAENIFPLRRAIILNPMKDFSYISKNIREPENIEALEEERRLAYVALTRTKQKLFLSFSVGQNQKMKNSRFLKEAKIKETSVVSIAKNFTLGKEINKNDNLIVGDYIAHQTFGKGVILNLSGRILEIKFLEDKKVRKIDRLHPAIKKWEESDV